MASQIKATGRIYLSVLLFEEGGKVWKWTAQPSAPMV
jgi:hypothetical protein